MTLKGKRIEARLSNQAVRRTAARLRLCLTWTAAVWAAARDGRR